MGKRIIRINRIISGFVFFLFSLLALSCNRELQMGMYIAKPFYRVDLDGDGVKGVFRLKYRWDYLYCENSGTWCRKYNRLYFSSNVGDDLNFSVHVIPHNIGSDTTMPIVFKNFNMVYYDVYCISNCDTIHIKNDTLSRRELGITDSIKIQIRPITTKRLRELPIGENPTYYELPWKRFVQSEQIAIPKVTGCDIVVDSVFGENPLHYKVMKEEVFVITKNGIRDHTKGFELFYTDSTNMGSPDTPFNPCFDETRHRYFLINLRKRQGNE